MCLIDHIHGPLEWPINSPTPTQSYKQSLLAAFLAPSWNTTMPINKRGMFVYWQDLAFGSPWQWTSLIYWITGSANPIAMATHGIRQSGHTWSITSWQGNNSHSFHKVHFAQSKSALERWWNFQELQQITVTLSWKLCYCHTTTSHSLQGHCSSVVSCKREENAHKHNATYTTCTWNYFLQVTSIWCTALDMQREMVYTISASGHSK